MTAIPPVDDLDRDDAVAVSIYKWSRKKKLLAAAIALVLVAGGIGGATVTASATQHANAQATADNTSSAFHADAVKHTSAAAALKSALSDASALLPALNSLVSGGTGYLADADINSLRNVQGDLQAQVTVAAKVSATTEPQSVPLKEGTTDELIAYTSKLNNQSKHLIDNTDALLTAAAKLMTHMKSTAVAVAVASTNLAPAVHTIQSATQNADQPSKDAFATAVSAVKSVNNKPTKDLVAALNSYITSAKGIQAASAAQAAADASARAAAAAAAQTAAAEAAKQAAAARQPGSPACAGTPTGVKHIYVSISQQHLWACTGDVLLTDTAVTTGASALTNVHYATPIGTSHITGKSRNTVLAGRDVNGPWNDPVKFWMPFDGGIGFHDSSWQTFPYGSDLYKTQGSHGCVHVPAAVIATLFDWAPIGTLVTVTG
jgi:hypothetical protein